MCADILALFQAQQVEKHISLTLQAPEQAPKQDTRAHQASQYAHSAQRMMDSCEHVQSQS